MGNTDAEQFNIGAFSVSTSSSLTKILSVNPITALFKGGGSSYLVTYFFAGFRDKGRSSALWLITGSRLGS